MNRLYKDHDLGDIIKQIFAFITPVYQCVLDKKYTSDTGSLACTSTYFAKLWHMEDPKRYKRCSIHKVLKPMCALHCKAYPIQCIMYREMDKVLSGGQAVDTDFVHFRSKRIANFFPHIFPGVTLHHPCCSGNGWAILPPKRSAALRHYDWIGHENLVWRQIGEKWVMKNDGLSPRSMQQQQRSRINQILSWWG